MLTDYDTATLITYLEMQRIRVPRQAKTAQALKRATVLTLAPTEVVEAIHSGKVTLTIKDSARFNFMRALNGKLHPWFGAMEWEIYEAEPGAAFVTTDSPVSLYNPAVLPPLEPGLAHAGTIVFFPLSSRHALLMRHATLPQLGELPPLAILDEPPVEDGLISIAHGVVWNKYVVDNFNKKMVHLCDDLVVAESKEALEACLASRLG